MLENREVVCLSCKEEVVVKLVNFGGGKIATCPKCGKLACNLDK